MEFGLPSKNRPALGLIISFLMLLSPISTSAGNDKVKIQQSAAVTASTEESTDPHEKLFQEKRFPSATTCKTCHPRQYRQWSVSQHAYAQ